MNNEVNKKRLSQREGQHIYTGACEHFPAGAQASVNFFHVIFTSGLHILPMGSLKQLTHDHKVTVLSFNCFCLKIFQQITFSKSPADMSFFANFTI